MSSSDVEMDDVEGVENDEIDVPDGKRKVYIPGISRPLHDGEELDYDPSAYRIFHTFETELPCLSFDVIRDDLGDNRSTFPLQCYIIGGTQAEKVKDNQLIVMRLSNMHEIEKEKEDDDSSNSSDDDDADEETKAKAPRLHGSVIPHYGDVNRVKCENIGVSPVCAIWNDQCKVQIWNLTDSLAKVEEMEGPSKTVKLNSEKPLYTYSGHGTSGYALGWSPLKNGALASGDNHRKIFLWNMSEGGKWLVDQRPLTGHESSVEDLQWSPSEEPLLVSCSADGSIRLWDVRTPGKDACVHTVKNAHDSDVNVISWNRFDPLIVSGGDDGIIKIWSLKTIQYNQSVAAFKHHKGPITSVEWHNEENTTLMASGEDNQVTIWDLAMEADEQEEENSADASDSADTAKLPPQLLFVHMGANEIKELHWHPQITGLVISTALDGFHAFRTINV